MDKKYRFLYPGMTPGGKLALAYMVSTLVLLAIFSCGGSGERVIFFSGIPFAWICAQLVDYSDCPEPYSRMAVIIAWVFNAYFWGHLAASSYSLIASGLSEDDDDINENVD